MRNKLLLILLSLLLVPSLASCKSNENLNSSTDIIEGESTNNNESTDNGSIETEGKPETGTEGEATGPETGTEGETTNPNGGTDSESTNPDEGGDVVVTKNATIKEALELAGKVNDTYKEDFDAQTEVIIKGKLLSDFAMSSTYHFMIMADETGIIPVCVSANGVSLGKFVEGNSYEVKCNPGIYRKTRSLKALGHPTNIDNINVDLNKFSKDGNIEALYNEAYSLYYEENKAQISTNITRFTATYVDKINENLMLVFDGSKHIILHGNKRCNNGMTLGMVYEFMAMPTVYQGKRGAEYISSKATGVMNNDYKEEMKNVAVAKEISDISKLNRYDDEGLAYPHIIKVEAYVLANVIDGKYHLVLAPTLDTKVIYQKNVNERPNVIYAKNHVIADPRDERNSILAPYYVNETKGTFYFVVSEYQSNYHAFQAQILDLDTNN